MGQRLNLEIQNSKGTIANAYYHWSGYTSSSLELTKQVIKQLEKIQLGIYIDADDITEENTTLLAIRLLESTRAGLTEEEKNAAKTLLPEKDFADCIDRNYGLIAITDKGIQETRRWAESSVYIDIKERTVNCRDIFFIDSEEDYLNNYEQQDTNDLEQYEMPSSFILPFDAFNDFADIILNYIKNKKYTLYDPVKKLVYHFIE